MQGGVEVRMAPQVGLEPTTLRLTVRFSSPRRTKLYHHVQRNTRKPAFLVAPLCFVLVRVHGQKAYSVTKPSWSFLHTKSLISGLGHGERRGARLRRPCVMGPHVVCQRGTQ